MVVASDTGQVADLVFVVEGTANMGAYLGELKANYIVPTLECFNGGPAEDRECGSELTSTLYALIVFMAADAAPEPSVSCGSAPTTSINKFLSWLDRVPFLGGAAEGCSHIVEGLGTALQAFNDFQALREPHLTTQKHCILICNSPPYPLPCCESMAYLGLGADQLASMMAERGINLSIISPRKIPALFKLYDKAGGDLQLAQNKNYTKDRRHLVLLKGYQLQERPLSPASAELKDKPQLSIGPLQGIVLPSDKPLIAPNPLALAGSPGSNSLMQTQPKGTAPGQTIGKKRPGGSPPNPPPFKQLIVQQGNHPVPVGHSLVQQQQQSLQGQPSLMGPQQQPLASVQPPMPTAPSIPAPLSQMHIGIPSKLNQQPRNMANLSVGPNAMGMNRGPITSAQTTPSFMNQPNPPNVTISKGSPMPPMMTGQPMDTTSMGRPIRDQTPMNAANMNNPRMIWNTQQMGPRAPGAPGGLPPNQNMGQAAAQGVSQLVLQLQQQPGRPNPGILQGQNPRMVGNDMIRPPNVTSGPPGQPNTSGPVNVLNIMQSSNIGPGGPIPLNQSLGIQQNVNQGQQSNLTAQMNIGPMNNPPSALQNQLGAQGQRFLLLQSMTGNQPQIGNTSMASNQQQPNVNLLNSLGNIGQTSLSGPMNQPNSMTSVGAHGPMPQPQQVSQPQNQPQASLQGQQQQPPVQKERRVVWQGVVEWQEKPKLPAEPSGKINRQVHCQVSSSLNAMGEPEVNADKWPKKLIMQLIPKLLMQHFGHAFLKMARNVIFHFNNNMETAEALGNLNKVMSNGFIGCVHFSPHQNANCDIRILMLIYCNDKHTYVGFIPNDQPGFVAAIRNVITKKQQLVKTQQLQQHMLGPEGGPGAQQISQITSTMNSSGMPINLPGPVPGQGSQQHVGTGGPPPSSAAGAPPSIPTSVAAQGGPLPNASVGAGGPGIGPLPPGGMQSLQQTGLMGQHANPGNAPSGPPGPDGGGAAGGMNHGGTGAPTNQAHEMQLAAERKENLIKIQQLRLSLEAAQQKEMQLKAAQDHQKQHLVPHPPIRQQNTDLFGQMQQQQQQQQQQPSQRLLHVGGNTSSANNPQLRHLLQIRQQQQLMQQQQQQQQQLPGQRPMAPGQMGPVPGPGQQQNPNHGGNIFGDDIM